MRISDWSSDVCSSDLEKNRFIPEESGRLLTAFLERFFTRYVGYDFTAGLEEELDDVSGGRAQWQAVLDRFWRDFKPRTGEVMEQKPSEITAALRSEEHTSELQSLMRISYAVFCMKKKKIHIDR